MLNKLVLPASITLVFLSAILAAWGTSDHVVVFGKGLMSATIFAFVVCNYLEGRSQRWSAPQPEQEAPDPAGKFLLGSIYALAVGAMSLSTLSDDWPNARKNVVIFSAAAIAVATVMGFLLGKARSTRSR